MEIIDIIKQIENEKRTQKKVPDHAMILEVLSIAVKHGYTPDSVDEYLSTLSELGHIQMGETINSKYIKSI